MPVSVSVKNEWEIHLFIREIESKFSVILVSVTAKYEVRSSKVRSPLERSFSDYEKCVPEREIEEGDGHVEWGGKCPSEVGDDEDAVANIEDAQSA